MKKKPINKYRRKITDEKELKAVNRLLFTKGKQRYQLYCRYLYSEKYLTRAQVRSFSIGLKQCNFMDISLSLE